ncbi:hypothetical protein D3C81_1365040 [compost metagenome]
MRLHGHFRRVAGEQTLETDRVAVHFPTQALGHVANRVITGVGIGDGFLQYRFQRFRFQVGLHVTQHVHRAGFHPVGLRIQRTGRDAHRFAVFVIALGIQVHLRGRHAEVGVLQTEFRQQGLRHCLVKRLAEAFRGQITEQPKAWI